MVRRDLQGIDGQNFIKQDVPELLSKGKLKGFEGAKDKRSVIIEGNSNRAVTRKLNKDPQKNYLHTGYRIYGR